MANKLSGKQLAAVLVGGAVAVFVVGAAFSWRWSAPAGDAERPRAQLVATVRSEPRSFNRLIVRDRTSSLLGHLLHARLVRIDLLTQEVEPALAERWTVSSDGREIRLDLRPGVRFSDGAPFTSADVTFTFAAVLDPKVGSPLAEALEVGGQPIAVTAPDERTVVVRFAEPYGPGVRLLDIVPILPRHRLGAALEQGGFRDAWGLSTSPADLVGLGPFVLDEYRPGERLVFARNPHYWRRGADAKRLPLLDRLVVAIVPDQNTEILRLESGESDLMGSEVRPDDLAAVRRLAREGRLLLHDLGVGLDPDFLCLNLAPGLAQQQPRRAWLQRRELRLAISAAVDRQAFADTVYLGAAVPVGGPVTPGNREWHNPRVPPPVYDPALAGRLLGEIGLRDNDRDGQREAADGTPAGFSLLTQKGNTLRERSAQFLQEELRKVGLKVDVVTLDQPAVIDRVIKGDFEAIYFGAQYSDTDPASNLDFWKSDGAFHVWHPGQASPATEWERRIDDLMRRQVAARDASERRQAFDEVQRIFAVEQPAIYFVAPRVHVATSVRVAGARPALLQPSVLWNADRLSVRQPGS